jgi:toxin ParE1/3/4
MSYRLSPAARADLRSIWLYTDETWSRGQADRYIVSIETVCENLAAGQEQGRSADHFRKGYRMAPAGSHFVFYKSSDDGGIQIMRILHQRMNIRSRLFERQR